jgi:hypothetical protein
MAKTTDLINSVGVGEDGVSLAYPDTFLADIETAFADDMGLADSRVSILEADNAALASENQALKAEMYELVRQIPSTDDNVSGDESGTDDSDPEDVSIDDLFSDNDK